MNARASARPAVVFLARGTGGGLAAAEAFLASYLSCPAGADHQLVVLRKGFADAAEAAALDRLAARHDATVLDLPDDGFDWAAYFRAAERLPNTRLLLLNTHSRLQHPDWLARMLAAAELPGGELVGATGSWQTVAPSLRYAWPLVRWVAANRSLLHGAAEAIQQYGMIALGRLHPRGRSFAGFPNVHLRSNALFIPRQLLCEFAAGQAIPRTKEDAFRLESGRAGLTAFVRRRGLGVLVAGADGRATPPEAWDRSGTFRTPGQPNLLIGDNQTRNYDAADARTRTFLELLTWGRVLSA